MRTPLTSSSHVHVRESCREACKVRPTAALGTGAHAARANDRNTPQPQAYGSPAPGRPAAAQRTGAHASRALQPGGSAQAHQPPHSARGLTRCASCSPAARAAAASARARCAARRRSRVARRAARRRARRLELREGPLETGRPAAAQRAGAHALRVVQPGGARSRCERTGSMCSTTLPSSKSLYSDDHEM